MRNIHVSPGPTYQATHNVPNQEIPTIVICNQPQYRETCDWTANQTLSLSKQGLSKCLNHVTIFAYCKIRTYYLSRNFWIFWSWQTIWSFDQCVLLQETPCYYETERQETVKVDSWRLQSLKIWTKIKFLDWNSISLSQIGNNRAMAIQSFSIVIFREIISVKYNCWFD